MNLDNSWVTVRLKLRLHRKSENLWMEFVGFQRIIKWQMINDIDRPGPCVETKKWIFDTMKTIHDLQINVQNYHGFPNPPTGWLSNFTPSINQSILLATAYPPVIADMSTIGNCQFRIPLQWATFCHYRENLAVERNPLPISLLTQQASEY